MALQPAERERSCWGRAWFRARHPFGGRKRKDRDWCDGCDDGGLLDACSGLDGCDIGFLLGPLLVLTAWAVLTGQRDRVVVDERRYPSALARLAATAVRAYQERTSLRWGARCRYTPSCSTYALDALAVHGLRRGTLLARARLRRCRPGGGRGWDPVPSAVGEATDEAQP
ncbi:hypothetical protein EV189_3661 [Motilibacter rhizosphaerae]|uniref:Putative membrane protein insertion efficiency factor n=1 Tax=Motilibacter rhizosphaerae TaxID=598652 RepID=A0A4Q7NBH3_9ACTN|nr:membrane protein insertion efficiency factor YidD [Motilibacter rhizosphaerae]RZS80180.1 hypothetical protein EV189_3661 [Motilibacter rhizosphaerae]